MSGRRIDDHRSFAGKPGKLALPEGNKVEHSHSSEGAGHLMDQERDTDKGIHRDQSHGDSKIKSHVMKPGYRN